MLPEIEFTADAKLTRWTPKPYLDRMTFTWLPGVIPPFAGPALIGFRSRWVVSVFTLALGS